MKFIVVAFAFIASASAVALKQSERIADTDTASTGANPVRKVVTMLQMMIKKIEAQGKKEQELFDKYMCYCKTSDLTLTKEIEEANTKIPQLESEIKEAVEHKATLEVELNSHMTDRDAAKTAMAKATAVREKEHAAFLKEEASDKANIEALGKAVKAIGDGMAGGFLQTSDAQLLRQLSVANANMLDIDRQMLVSFLTGSQSGSEGYVPKSAEILGILKQLKDEMEKDLAEMTATENAAAQTYEELMSAKKKELETLNASVEAKLKRTGELGVEIAMKKNDLEDTKEDLGEDTLFLADLVKNCGTKKEEWEAICKTRSEELIALQETIKILNDDDALELFKKTLPSASFLQLEGSLKTTRLQALKVIKDAMKNYQKSPHMDFIELALRGKKEGFEKVIKLIDEMVVTLKTEQSDDDHKKEYCEVQFDIADDKKKELERTLSDTEKVIAETTDAIGAVSEEIKGLEASIQALDKSVVEATVQRKDEHADYADLMASNNAAKELILFAKNRMQKFYNPKLYKPPPKRELTEEERITLNMGGTLAPTNPPGGIAGTGVSLVQVHVHKAKKDAPPPPPSGPSAYKKKSEESGGVLAMMDMLVAELDKEMTEAEVEEKDAQKDYEKLMMDSSALRAGDSKLITEKTAAKAEMETELQSAKDTKLATAEELKATKDYIQTLHSECDWLLENYSVRKEARASEVDALKKAKAILSGADFSLMQTSIRLRGAKI